ncbi:MAG TPA: class I SAM-dependent methyltransferase [Candidatus Brocadiia bacterium]|nr:class I SAM-dependent methyltransferase [Candidatus Brocadiia bacterium]
MTTGEGEMQRYRRSCQSDFWRSVFAAEKEILVRELGGAREVLSVGCGPAVIESMLTREGFRVTGLDVSQEALALAPDGVRAVAGRAEDMPFPPGSFDAVIYVASLQFIEDYRTAIRKTAETLRPEGRLVVMLLNPASAFFRARAGSPASYVSKVRHTNLAEIEAAVSEWFQTRAEYAVGIDGERVFESKDPAEASLYVVCGTPRLLRKSGEW